MAGGTAAAGEMQCLYSYGALYASSNDMFEIGKFSAVIVACVHHRAVSCRMRCLVQDALLGGQQLTLNYLASQALWRCGLLHRINGHSTDWAAATLCCGMLHSDI